MQQVYRSGNDMAHVENSVQFPEMDRFRAVLKDVLSVSKKELDRRLARDKAAKADKPKRGPKPCNGDSSILSS